jgi:hypothetical protein
MALMEVLRVGGARQRLTVQDDRSEDGSLKEDQDLVEGLKGAEEGTMCADVEGDDGHLCVSV